LAAYRGKLKGKFVMMYRPDTLNQSFKADAARFTDEQLTTMANNKPTPPDTAQQRRIREQFRRGGNFTMVNRVRDLAKEEGALSVLSAIPMVMMEPVCTGRRSHQLSLPENMPMAAISFEDYMTIQRLALAGIPVQLEAEVKTKFDAGNEKAYNVFGEIRGVDSKLKDEVVMLGGHLDSWQSATGATDNAAGCSVMLEAMRILKSLGVKPRRIESCCGVRRIRIA
jgi:hypothetical protein